MGIDDMNYSQKAVTVLTKVRDLLQQYPYLYSWNWNCCDNIGQLLLVVNEVNPPQLNHLLYCANPSYCQTNWINILDDYIDRKIHSSELNRCIALLFSTFIYQQLVEINNSYNVIDEYASYMSFLNAVIIQKEDQLLTAA